MGREREPKLDALRTRMANQAASLAETVTDGFEGFHMGAGDYVVELMPPEGQSTGGGWQARQSIRLVPRRKGYAVIVVGSVDPVTSTGEVRTFEHVAVLHELRFRHPLEVTFEEYADFLAKLDVVLNLAQVRSFRVPPTPDLLEQQRALYRSSVSLPTVVTLVVGLVLLGFALYRLVRG